MLTFSHTKYSSSYLHSMGSGSVHVDKHLNESGSGGQGLDTITVLTLDHNCCHS